MPGPRCGHTLTAVSGPEGDFSGAKLIMFGEAGTRILMATMLPGIRHCDRRSHPPQVHVTGGATALEGSQRTDGPPASPGPPTGTGKPCAVYPCMQQTAAAA